MADLELDLTRGKLAGGSRKGANLRSLPEVVVLSLEVCPHWVDRLAGLSVDDVAGQIGLLVFSDDFFNLHAALLKQLCLIVFAGLVVIEAAMVV